MQYFIDTREWQVRMHLEAFDSQEELLCVQSIGNPKRIQRQFSPRLNTIFRFRCMTGRIKLYLGLITGLTELRFIGQGCYRLFN
jgi:hypothetical protein